MLGEEEEDTIETESFLAAKEMGIFFLKEKIINYDVGNDSKVNEFSEENIKEEEELGLKMKLNTTRLEKSLPDHIQGNRFDKAEQKIGLNTANEFVFEDENETQEKRSVCKKLKKIGMRKKKLGRPRKITNIETDSKIGMKKKKLGRPKKITNTETNSSDKTCDQCFKSFSSSGNLYNHKKNLHSDTPPMPCQHCVLKRRDMEDHIKRVHTLGSTRSFICDECGKSFKTKKDVSGHKRSHLPNDIKEEFKMKKREVNKCIICGQGFTDKTKLKRHEAARHDGIKDFHCQQCPKSYYRSDHLKSHVASFHASDKFKLEYNPVLFSPNITDIAEIF